MIGEAPHDRALSVRARRLGRAAAVVALVVAALGMAAAPDPAPAAEASPEDGTTIEISPATAAPRPGAYGARSSTEQIRGVALGDEGMQQAMQYRPGSVMTFTWRSSFGNWSVHLREVGGTLDLARVVVDDRTHRITDRFALPFDRYPPRLTERQAIAIARRDGDARREIDARGGMRRLDVDASLHEGRMWEVDFVRGRKVVLQVDVLDSTAEVDGVWTGHQIAWKMARGNRYAFGGDINLWYAWLPLFVAFALVMVSPRHLWSLHTVDVLALLSFGISHELFNRGMLAWSVPLAMPPLVWLFLRMAWLFARGVPPLAPRAGDPVGSHRLSPDEGAPRRAAPVRAARRIARMLLPWPATWLLIVVAIFGAGLRYGVNYYGSNVIDVGYAGVAGAQDLLDHRTPYGHMPQDNPHGDTYGPLNYVAYLPAAAIWRAPADNEWGGEMPAAHAVSVASDLLCTLALVLVGWRWISRRAAAMLAAGWMTYPYAAFALENNTNDLLVAALLLLAFAALPRALLRGAFVAAAAGVKFVPIVALGALAHAGVRRRRRQAVLVLVGVLAVAAACVAIIHAYPHGWKRFVDATWRFQYGRESPFSVWGLYGWRRAQQVVQVALLVLVAASVFLPVRRDFRQVAAGMAAAIIGAEIVLQHWFYLYVPWFAGLVMVVLVARREAIAAPTASGAMIEPAPSALAVVSARRRRSVHRGRLRRSNLR